MKHCKSLLMPLLLALIGINWLTPPLAAQKPPAAATDNDGTLPALQITSATAYPKANTNGAGARDYILDITGTGFGTDPSKVKIVLLPNPKANPVAQSAARTEIIGTFSANAGYVLRGAALFISGDPVSYEVPNPGCDIQQEVSVLPHTIAEDDAGDLFGDGVKKHFYVIELSITNGCGAAIQIPESTLCITTGKGSPCGDYLGGQSTNSDECEANYFITSSLAHVTSLYNADRTLTGTRAIYFNSLQAGAALGSALAGFFGHGFTQAVAILGGGFTTASKDIFVDMSSVQLQNLASQSFGELEQVPPGGPVTKFIFVQRPHHCSSVDQEFHNQNYALRWQAYLAPQQATMTATSAGGNN